MGFEKSRRGTKTVSLILTNFRDVRDEFSPTVVAFGVRFVYYVYGVLCRTIYNAQNK